MKNQHNQDDAQKLLQQFSKEASFPDRDFYEQLKKRGLDETQNRNLLFNIFKMKNLKFAAIFIGIFLVLGIIGGGGYLLLNRQQETSSTTELLSGTEKDTLLKNVILENPQASINPQARQIGLNQEKEYPAEEAFPGLKQYAYSYSKVTTEFGPAVSIYPSYTFYQQDGEIVETWEYIDDNAFYYKTLTKDKDGNLTNYALEAPGGYYEYMGGKYAVKFVTQIEEYEKSGEKIEFADESSEETMQTDSNIIEMLFGADAVVEKIMENGKVKEYVITWKLKTSCCFECYHLSKNQISAMCEDEENAEKTIYVKSWINPDTFEVQKEEEYLQEIKDENLIISTNIDLKLMDEIAFEDVQENFEFEYDVEVQEIDLYSDTEIYDPEQEIKDMKKYLKADSVQVLFPKSQETSFDFATFYQGEAETEDNWNYIYDRDFYPEGDFGEKLYKRASEVYGNVEGLYPELTMSFSISSAEASYLSFDIFADGTTDEQILEAYIYEYEEEMQPENFDVDIEEQTVSALKYKYESGETGVVNSDGVTVEETRIYSVTILFSYKGKKYALTYDQLEEESDLDILKNLVVYDSSNTNDLNEFVQLVKNSIEKDNVYDEPGQSEPGSQGVEDTEM